jgi:2-dehydro-3-deoxygalactonokinase
MSLPALIAVDWGTSSLRATLVGRDGALLEHRSGGPGILAVAAGGFGAVLASVVGEWRGAIPMLLSGMIGSRQGWVEAPYLACPAGGAEIAKALLAIDGGALGTVHIAPGLAVNVTGSAPDVMRGEETQIIGALHATGLSDGLFVLPGTHSKWVTVVDGRIVGFATFMTGEIFAALRHHTILGRLMPDGAELVDEMAFKRGVEAGAAEGPPGALLQRVFAARTLGLFGQLPAEALSSYLSGLLIGAELAAAIVDRRRTSQFRIIGSAAALTKRYRVAADVLTLDARLAPDDCAARGAWVLACASGLIESKMP